MRLDVAAIRANDATAISQLSSLCTRCARIGARSFRAYELVDDVAQELVLLFLTDLIDRYDPELDVEPLLIESARRITSGMLRKSWREHAVGGVEEGNPLDGAATEEDAAEMAARMESRAKAVQAREVLLARAKAAQARPAPAEEDALESLTNEEIEQAARQVMVALEKIARERGIDLPEGRAIQRRRKTKRSIGEAMQQWAARLGISTADPSWHIVLADRIGAHRATVWRWRAGRTHPSQAIMDSIEAIVTHLEDQA